MIGMRMRVHLFLVSILSERLGEVAPWPLLILVNSTRKVSIQREILSSLLVATHLSSSPKLATWYCFLHGCCIRSTQRLAQSEESVLRSTCMAMKLLGQQ